MNARIPPEPDPGGPGEIPPPAAGGPPGERLLRRSASDKVLAGVCGGLGRYLGVEPFREENGLGNRLDIRSDDFDTATRRLLLELRAGIGEIRVER